MRGPVSYTVHKDMLPLGDPETAVVSLVNLISTATGANEQKLAYWLDAYYQARLAYEKANAPEPDPTILRRADLEPVIRQLWEESLHKSCRKEAAKRLDDRGPIKRKKIEPEIYPVERIETADLQELQDPLSGMEVVPPALSPAAAAAFKRRTRDWLLEQRAAGLTIADIVKAAAGSITDGQLLTILDGGKQPIEVYRALDAALDKVAITKPND